MSLIIDKPIGAQLFSKPIAGDEDGLIPEPDEDFFQLMENGQLMLMENGLPMIQEAAP